MNADRRRRNMAGVPRALDAPAAALITAIHDHAIISVTDVHGRIVDVNDAFCAVSGYRREELIGQPQSIVNSGHHPPAFFAELWRTISAGEVWHGTVRNRAKDGRLYWVRSTIEPYRDGTGDIGGYVSVLTEVTGLLAAQESLRETAEILTTTLASVSQGIAMFDREQRLVVCNERYAELYGLSPDQVERGTTVSEIVQSRIANGIHAGADPGDYILERTRPVTDASAAVHELSDGRAIQVRRKPLANGGWVTTHEDITDRQHALAQVAYLAHHDALTGLANRVLLLERIDLAIGRLHRRGERFNVMILDLDKFKAVNDTLGHAAGDALIKSVAARLRATIRETDTIARLGGDEFAVVQICEADAREAGRALARRLLDAIAAPHELGGQQVTVGTSIGIATAPRDGADVGRLLKCADLALYRVKAEGRDDYRFFETGMDREAQDRHALERDLRAALGRHELVLHYQPVIDTATRAISGVEALLRWQHPQRGVIGPDRFIPIAEETGLIAPIGEWALRQACADAAGFPSTVTVAVNLSTAQFGRGNLVKSVTDALVDVPLAPGRLELEITESVLMRRDNIGLARLHQLRDLGVRIVLDDFGTGYSSLSYLQMFPFSRIKIDRSFVSQISRRADSAAIVCAVAGLARSLDMLTTAEGVETHGQVELLRAAGVDQLQGYLFGRPMPRAELRFDQSDKRAAARSNA